MRFFFATLIVTLLSLAVWPWIQQFFFYIKSKYEEATTFEQEPEELEPKTEEVTPEEPSPIHEKKESEDANEKND